MAASPQACVGPAFLPAGRVVDLSPRRNTALLVEDDSCLARLFGVFLERCGLRTVHARDGADCLRLFEVHRHELALVLMDCGLPDVHGGTLCHRLRALSPGLSLLLTSGTKQPALHALLASDGPTGFLAKPFLPADALREIRAMIPASGSK